MRFASVISLIRGQLYERLYVSMTLCSCERHRRMTPQSCVGPIYSVAIIRSRVVNRILIGVRRPML